MFTQKFYKAIKGFQFHFALIRTHQSCISHCESNSLHVVFHQGDNTTRPREPDKKQQTFVYSVVFHPHRFAAFCELTAVTIEGKQLDHISRNVREVPFQKAQRVSLSRRYGESNQEPGLID